MIRIDKNKSPEQLLEELKVLELINSTPLEELLEKQVTEVEKALATVKLKPDGRKAAGKKRASKNARRRRRRRYDMVTRYKTRVKIWTMASEGDWYPRFREQWRKKGFRIGITQEQWESEIRPSIPDGVLIAVRRYDTKSPVIGMDTIFIIKAGTTEVLWDGKDWKLKKIGAAL